MKRYTFFGLMIALALASCITAIYWPWSWLGFIVFTALSLLGVYDVLQTRHSLLRNYPVLAHMRWIFEGIRPEIRQYLLESDRDEEPFSREKRSIVYQRAKGVEDKRPFGTREDVYGAGYAWMNHSILPIHGNEWNVRTRVGGPDCKKPYDASIYNISAMSFGALSGSAICALNTGAAKGGFAHDTGEGGISRHHRQGGDLIFEIGSGYFGCRDAKGGFDPDRFAALAAEDQVRMIEVKLSQGAKPGHGGVLPAAKVSPEIAEARGIPVGQDSISPASHSSFSTPLEFMDFLKTLRELSGGKPVGFKLCIGHRREFMCMVKAMLETGTAPDFIVVDGKEGGTGAAPLEFSNHMGTPLVEGLTFVANTLTGAGLRDRIRIGASGKLVTAFDLSHAFALGADWCNSARGFMFSIGCIQAQACHTNRCPVGVATQDPLRQRALDVADKSERVKCFHENTLKAVAEFVGAMGLSSPAELAPRHFMMRQKTGDVLSGAKAFEMLPEGCLVDGDIPFESYRVPWENARPDSFSHVE